MVSARGRVSQSGQVVQIQRTRVKAGKMRVVLWAAAATTALGATIGRAATTDTWTAAGTANWSNAASWNSGTPVSGNALVFDGTNQLATNNDINGLTISGITFNPGAGGFVLANKGITLSGDATDNTVSMSSAWRSHRRSRCQ